MVITPSIVAKLYAELNPITCPTKSVVGVGEVLIRKAVNPSLVFDVKYEAEAVI